MLKLSVLLVCAFVGLGKSQEDGPTVVPILSSENIMEPDGNFHYNFETGDGIKTHEEGHLKQVNNETVEVVEGGFEFDSPDGQHIAINYVADETGYHPTGDSIPVAPPLPESVSKLLKYLEEHPPAPGTIVSKK